MKNGSPNLVAQNMEFFRQAMDRGAISGFTGGGGRSAEISGRREGNPDFADEGKLNGIMAVSESLGFFVEGEVNPESAVRGKWKGVVAGTKGAHVRGAEVSGEAGENILSNRVTPKLKMAERNKEIMGGKGSRGTWISRIFFLCYRHVSSSYWSNISDLEDKVHLKRVGVLHT
jgi:hypothetical protein